jgi:putative MFS transporter
MGPDDGTGRQRGPLKIARTDHVSSDGHGGPARSFTSTGIAFHHPVAFWAGTLAIISGVALHLPDFAVAGDRGYRLAGMPMSGLMLLGMVLIVAGILLAGYGLFPRREVLGVHRSLEGLHFRAIDEARLTPAHWGLLWVLGIALVVDVMKPATLGFVVPGSKSEYGLTTAQVALLPLFALAGTTIGSVLWGVLADRLGRRASILLASLFFIGTAICGFMPSFAINLFMCFLMGLAAGGMLPIVYALMAESVPASKRGWLVVLHGGLGTVGGYLAAAGFAALLEPHFSWRILWFLNLPTGLLILVLNRWIPESPRFLLEHGRTGEAQQVMARYGVVLERDVHEAVAGNGEGEFTSWRRLRVLFRRPYVSQTMIVGSYGVGWGLVNWGFITFVPTLLRDNYGYDAGTSSGLLFLSALVAVPGIFVVAYLYGRSSKKTMILYALGTVAVLLGFVLIDPATLAREDLLLGALMVGLLVSSSGVISMLSPYTAEVFPTHLRGTGSGLAAGSSKLGGIVGPPVAAAVITLSAGLAAPALLVAAPMALAATLVAAKGIETTGRRLEDIQVSMASGEGRTAPAAKSTSD